VKSAHLIAAGLLAGAAPLAAQQTPASGAEQQQTVHVVRSGETLWDLARTYLADPFLWPEIFRLNTDVVEDPALIYPNERLTMPRGSRMAAAAPAEGRTVFYPSGREATGVMTIRAAGTAEFPIVRVGDFYRASWVAAPATLDRVGEMVEPISETVVPIQIKPQTTVFDKVLVRLSAQPGTVRIGDRVQFVRREGDYRAYGRMWRSAGLGTVSALDGATATVVVTDQFAPIQPADIVVRPDRFPVRTGVVPAPSTGEGLEGRVIGFQDVHTLYSVEDIAFLDLGRDDGVSEGDEFEVWVPAATKTWGEAPPVKVGELQVVRVTDRAASARITALSQPAMQEGLTVRRVKKMP
jgi:hypothetical protein